jgi:hypothetical protein
MYSAERLKLYEQPSSASIPWSATLTADIPPRSPKTAGGLSGRPRCRIFPVGRVWILQVEMASGWLIGSSADEPPMRLKFPTLPAAVAYAEQHGYDYRIITPSPVVGISERRRIPSGREGRLVPGSADGSNNLLEH